MIARRLEITDVPRLREIHARSGFEFDFPTIDLQTSLPAAASAIAEGELIAASIAVPTVEIYGWLDHTKQTPGVRLEAITALHREMLNQLRGKGYRAAHAWLPPQIAQRFSLRLMRDFQWSIPEWACVAFDLTRFR